MVARPSLFDLQVNGFARVDFQDPALTARDLRRACLALRRRRTYRILLTLVTDDIGFLERQFARIEAIRASDPIVQETVSGYHLEGPYLSPEDGYCGAHPSRFMKRPDGREFRRLQRAAGGHIRLVTLAPEWPSSERFIAELVGDGVLVSLGHTNASNRDIDRAIRAGARLCTHLGNACPALLHRHDNVIQRLLARDELTACFIPDGFHLPWFTLRNFLRSKPPDRIVLTTDCVPAAGAPPGPFLRRGRRLICERNGRVRLPGTDHHLAGSSLTLDRGVANASRHAGVPYSVAWGWASQRPAELFGVRLPLIDAPAR